MARALYGHGDAFQKSHKTYWYYIIILHFVSVGFIILERTKMYIFTRTVKGTRYTKTEWHRKFTGLVQPRMF